MKCHLKLHIDITLHYITGKQQTQQQQQQQHAPADLSGGVVASRGFIMDSPAAGVTSAGSMRVITW